MSKKKWIQTTKIQQFQQSHNILSNTITLVCIWVGLKALEQVFSFSIQGGCGGGAKEGLLSATWDGAYPDCNLKTSSWDYILSKESEEDLDFCVVVLLENLSKNGFVKVYCQRTLNPKFQIEVGFWVLLKSDHNKDLEKHSLDSFKNNFYNTSK
jgi:hypothetical protein